MKFLIVILLVGVGGAVIGMTVPLVVIAPLAFLWGYLVMRVFDPFDSW